MRNVLTLGIVGILICGAAVAEVGPGAFGGRDGRGAESFTFIATGPNSGADGYLEVEPDEYGSFGNFGVLPPASGDDQFNPAGPVGLTQVAFTDGFFLTVPDLEERALLTTIADWLAIFVPDADPINLTITGPSVASDTDGNGVPDKIVSSFRADSTNIALAFNLVQVVHRAGPGVATLRQDYRVTNEGPVTVTFRLSRVFDGDLIYDGDFESDEVGTLANMGGRGLFSFQREVGDNATATVLHGPGARSYFGGKNGVDPGMAGLPYGFGTDFQVWDNYGTPMNWENHIAGVGYDTDGVSGPMPPGAIDPEDAFIGLDWQISQRPGDTSIITVLHTYGSALPVVGGIAIGGDCPGTLSIQIGGGTAGGLAAILTGTSPGSGVVPGPCAGTKSGLDSPSLLAVQTYDSNGRVSLAPTVGAGACGRLLQVHDVSSCGMSNVATVP